MTFGSKLLNSFLMSAIYSFRKYLRYRQTSMGVGREGQGEPWHTLDFENLSKKSFFS